MKKNPLVKALLAACSILITAGALGFEDAGDFPELEPFDATMNEGKTSPAAALPRFALHPIFALGLSSGKSFTSPPAVGSLNETMYAIDFGLSTQIWENWDTKIVARMVYPVSLSKQPGQLSYQLYVEPASLFCFSATEFGSSKWTPCLGGVLALERSQFSRHLLVNTGIKPAFTLEWLRDRPLWGGSNRAFAELSGFWLPPFTPYWSSDHSESRRIPDPLLESDFVYSLTKRGRVDGYGAELQFGIQMAESKFVSQEVSLKMKFLQRTFYKIQRFQYTSGIVNENGEIARTSILVEWKKRYL